MKVGSPLTPQFGPMYKNAMQPAKVFDGCAPTRWFGEMSFTKYKDVGTLSTWWNQTQDGERVTNDGVAAFNYDSPPCQVQGKYDFDLGMSLFLGLAIACAAVGGLFTIFKRAQLVDEQRGMIESSTRDMVEAHLSKPTSYTLEEPVAMPQLLAPPPRLATDEFSTVDLAAAESADGMKKV